MAFFKADEKTLACDAWPGEIGRVMLERGKKVFPRHKLVPCDIEEVPTWLCVETDPDKGKALVMFRTDVASDMQGDALPITVRVLGILTDMDLSLDGDWDG
ncbi:hypothetical protein GSI_14044 [Ganoderma sinense ZZ0214-1]|uniref:Uncharacterized protein n=1 Tax=Ganoderma sinense ZZ0214-1 TaxID=1077348 RepID=A0A2G8RS27_9APHY|nr:hypothetical protein GSI_14044 [Ganoderma sinense ZZ0214-1]